VPTFAVRSFRQTNLRGTVCGGTGFTDLDLSQAKGLETATHRGPSVIDLDTLHKSKDRVPELFFRGCGVPENLLTYLHAGAGIAFDSCFISFTEADDAFSRRLYSDLQVAGVCCWRWKEDARWGATLMREVDDAVRRYDKLIVICSAESLKAEGVMREIERALQREHRENREVLFPIRIDDAVFSWKHALQADVVRKHIGDFRDWRNPAAYNQAMDRLIQSLRSARVTSPTFARVG